LSIQFRSELSASLRLAVLLLTSLSLLLPITAAAPAEFDLVIVGGRVLDGAGNPWFDADIGIRGGKIIEIGKIDPARAQEKILAQGLVVAPGFIDVHTHIEGGIEQSPDAENFLMMGVTTVVTGNCGSSALNLDAWLNSLQKNGIGINVASLVGHNTVRSAAMGGNYNRPPTNDELTQMRTLVEQAMKDGAVGFSTGLEYLPGAYANAYEITELARVAARYGGLYATHMRDEGEFVDKSVAESIAVGEQAHCPVEISHFKISSKKRWGQSAVLAKMVEDARNRGVQVTVDEYMYPASSTNLGILFNPWVFEGGNASLKDRLNDPGTRERVRKDVVNKANANGFNDLSFAYVASYDPDQSFNGRNLADITRQLKNKTDIDAQADVAIDMLSAGGARLVLKKMSEEDVEGFLKQPFTMIASDAQVMTTGGSSVPHPRNFGNNARALGYYVRERKLITLPEAIRRMTSLPAQTFKLWDRGLIWPGMAADLVLFDENTIRDLATFEHPKRYPVGIQYVIVNGKVAVNKSVNLRAKAGVTLRARGVASSVYTEPSSTQTVERALRVRDEAIQRRFNELQKEWKARHFTRQQYLDVLLPLQMEQLKLFEDARKTQFTTPVEQEYWHRDRLKFPSEITQEVRTVLRSK
jgi:N-acyl-D-amino-acid deacylase